MFPGRDMGLPGLGLGWGGVIILDLDQGMQVGMGMELPIGVRDSRDRGCSMRKGGGMRRDIEA